MATSLFSGKSAHHLGQVVFLNCKFMPAQNTLEVADKQYHLENKQTLVLLFLLANAGAIVKKDSLLGFAWKNRTVGDDVLTVAVSHLRKILGDSARSPDFIKTVTGEGYQFVGAISEEYKALAQKLLNPGVDEETEAVAPQLGTGRPYARWIPALFVVASLVGVLFVTFTGAQQEKMTADDWQQAETLLLSGEEAGWRKALTLYEQLTTAHPDNPEGYLGIAEAQLKILRFHPRLRYQAGDELRSLVNKTIMLAPALTRAHELLAEIEFRIFWNFEAAENSYKEALRLDSGNSRTYMLYSQFQLALGNFSNANWALKKSRDLNPRLYAIPSAAWINNMQRNYSEALVELEKLMLVRPDTLSYHISAQSIYENMGESKRSFEHLRRVLQLVGYADAELTAVEVVYDGKGLSGVYHWLAFEKQEARYIGQYLPPLSHARYAVKANEIDAALNYLEQALAERQTELLWLNVDPKYDPLRKEPRFQAIVKALGLPLNET